MLRTIGWWGIRIAVTLAGCYTLQHIISDEGYRAEFKDIVIAAVVVIVVMRFWAPRAKD